MTVPLAFESFCLTRGSMHMEDISFSVAEGEMFAILGRTGAGKTLLLESAAGFYTPEKGRVLLYGTPVQDIPLTERRIGFVYQDYALFPHMNVEKNITYGLRMRRMSRAKQERKVEEIASLVMSALLLKTMELTAVILKNMIFICIFQKEPYQKTVHLQESQWHLPSFLQLQASQFEGILL